MVYHMSPIGTFVLFFRHLASAPCLCGDLLAIYIGRHDTACHTRYVSFGIAVLFDLLFTYCRCALHPLLSHLSPLWRAGKNRARFCFFCYAADKDLHIEIYCVVFCYGGVASRIFIQWFLPLKLLQHAYSLRVSPHPCIGWLAVVKTLFYEFGRTIIGSGPA